MKKTKSIEFFTKMIALINAVILLTTAIVGTIVAEADSTISTSDNNSMTETVQSFSVSDSNIYYLGNTVNVYYFSDSEF